MDTEYKDLIEVFSATNNPKDMAKLFEEMLTPPSERKAILLRWNLMKDLYQGGYLSVRLHPPTEFLCARLPGGDRKY